MSLCHFRFCSHKIWFHDQKTKKRVDSFSELKRLHSLLMKTIDQTLKMPKSQHSLDFVLKQASSKEDKVEFLVEKPRTKKRVLYANGEKIEL